MINKVATKRQNSCSKILSAIGVKIHRYIIEAIYSYSKTYLYILLFPMLCFITLHINKLFVTMQRVMLSVIMWYHYDMVTNMLSIPTLSVIMLYVIVLCFSMFCTVMLSVIMLSVIMLIGNMFSSVSLC